MAKRLEVEWEDSTFLDDGRWVDVRRALQRRKSVRCLSVGVVLADDKRGIVLAAGVHGGEAHGVMVIPLGAVRKKRRLR